MQVYTDTGKLPAFKNAVITIGTFDGVHTGHRQIIRQLQEEAKQSGGETVIITFHPHPRRIVGPSPGGVELLNTIEEKSALLTEAGIDHLVICPFNESFSQLSAEQYITEFLLEKFHPGTIVIGYDHRFGKGRQGDYKLLEEYSERFGFRLTEIPGHLIDQNTVSSTKIREALRNGEAENAARLLGYPYFFTGKVIEGNKLGRTIGFPTANLEMAHPEKLVPGNGVYAVELLIEDHPASPRSYGSLELRTPGEHRYTGMMNIGHRPTVDAGSKLSIEVNIFDFDENIYGRNITIYLRQELRKEQKFPGLDALKHQLAEDRKAALRALKG